MEKLEARAVYFVGGFFRIVNFRNLFYTCLVQYLHTWGVGSRVQQSQQQFRQYSKKNTWIIIGLVIGVLFISALLSGKFDDLFSATPSSPSEPSVIVAPLGGSAILNGTAYTPALARVTKTIGDVKTENQFIVVTIKAENFGDKEVTVDNSQFVLIDKSNRLYKTSSDMDLIIALDSYFSVADGINPGLSKTGKVVFEVPLGTNDVALGVSRELFGSDDPSEYEYVKLNIEHENKSPRQ
ncbi:DUF4352 domain-containing protein [Paenibacillus xanthanilyticus]|uniref:DUF4352 domain-containing protein n=1 Tax=Paenibacillus xanthanilyticus TaxID=1783531 RepID=A0ABV8KA29_9BACL